MKKTYLKFLRRSVWRSKARFFSILAIVAIGVGFLGGLISTTPDMQLTMDRYFDENKLHDIDIKGPLGLTEDDIQAIGAIDGVESVTPAYVTDLIMENGDGSYVTRIYGMPQGKDTVNNFKLIEGRLPTTKTECLISVPNGYGMHFEVGHQLKISANNKDYDKIGDTYTFQELTVVGIVETPLFFSTTSEPSNVGSGKVQLVLFLPPDAYSMEVYTDAFVRLTGANALNTFSDDYTNQVESFTTAMEDLGVTRSKIRHKDVIDDANNELADARREYDEGKEKADRELTKAQKKLDDGKQEIIDNKKTLEDGKKELADGKKELADGEQQLADGKKKLEDGRAEIDVNRAELQTAKEDLETAQQELRSSIAAERQKFTDSIPALVEEQYRSLSAQIDAGEADAKAKLDESEAAVVEGEKQLAIGEQDLAAQEITIQNGYDQLQQGLAAYETNRIALAQMRSALEASKAQFLAEIEQQRADLEARKPHMSPEEYAAAAQAIAEAEAAGLAQLESQFAALATQEAALAEVKATLDATKAALDAASIKLQQAKAVLAAKKTELAASRQQIADGRKQLATEIAQKRAELENARPEIERQVRSIGMAKIDEAEAQAQTQIDAGAAEIADGEAQLQTAHIELQSGETEWTNSAAKLAEARKTISDSEQKLLDGEKELLDGERELRDGEKEYIDEKAKAEKELADGKIKIEDAQKAVNDIKIPEWIVLARSDIVSFSTYKSDSTKVSAIATIFPIFFFLVAALVALTTMTRLVEEERTQIGVFKALGYSRISIIFYYLGYSVAASLAGSVIGILLGYYTLPRIIATAYSMSYNIPPLIVKFWWSYALIIVPIAILCTTFAAWGACMNQLREKPSNLMLPRAPQAGKRILLERIAHLWKRFSFTQKITARNIFRYKKRFFMTVIGIAGCTALLVTGFGLRDSIRDIGIKQFGEIYNYDVNITLKEGGAAQNDPTVDALLHDQTKVTSYEEIHTENAFAAQNKCSILVPRNADGLVEQITLRNLESGKALDFHEDSAVITQKLSETLHLKVGDTLEVKNSNGFRGTVTITGIAENYVADFLFLSPKLYTDTFGEIPEYREIYATLADTGETFRTEFTEKMLGSDNVLLLLFNQTMQETFNNTVKNIDYIVMVLIVSAGALAMIVLYNLTNINICERKKELATIKVLGFHQREVALYIYRETMILCLIGIAVGLVLGIFLHAFVISTAEVDAVMFGRTIYPLSYVYAGAVTLFFTLLVDVIMLRKLRGIDMVESMKANE